ncbi:hypothetical protein P7L68_19455 [Tistrella mobilis]|uniref:hypothetical protein n=1 Tax=Tistrella mobilis TaxID=171437 RepID=UPI003555CAAE
MLDNALMVGFISAAVSIVVTVLTSILTRSREREADWRKLKFSQYQEFIIALSAATSWTPNAEARARYANAVNSLHLFASSDVVTALNAFQTKVPQTFHEEYSEERQIKLNELIAAIRRDLGINSNSSLTYSLFSAPPARPEDARGKQALDILKRAGQGNPPIAGDRLDD